MLNCSNDKDGGAATPDEVVDRAHAILIEALAMIDQSELPAHIGARLQHVIDDIETLR